MIIQQIFFAGNGLSMYMRGITFASGQTGRIQFNYKQGSVLIDESFEIKEGMVFTESVCFPIDYLYNWLNDNDAINEKGIVSNIDVQDICSIKSNNNEEFNNA